ncbi:Gfo/Idh/MocA family oxidoreductase [Oerskovia sp. Sa1BUA8]|uniref:Gfo/Idh/MocA family oxidoreductase n=1 Tax=Oerskovia douganii TaxID=2762210 RepID=A0A9D5UD48_9CELL|nr:Gfo/Idh/MocA family oxidoreductase [Oerskovia douganii]MBE7698747.1 Gfo/Idh/MocA family oxidoreductase [Oerskovia douganii]
MVSHAVVNVLDAVPSPGDAPPVRWGILGAGRIAADFADEVRVFTQGHVAAVGSRDEHRARDFVQRHAPSAAVHGSYEALVADPDVDVVYVATPHSHHRDHALLAIAAGRHVLVEKAFTRNEAEAREVFDAARAAGVFVMEAMLTRHLPHVAAIRALIAQGEVGEVRSVTAGYGSAAAYDPSHRLFAPELAGGALLDIGVYPLAFAMDLLGVPDAVTAVGLLAPTGVDAQSTVVLRYGDRATATLSSSVLARSATSLVVAGTGGRIEVADRFMVPTAFSVVWADGARREYDGFVPAGKQYEAAEVARCVAAGVPESPRMTWQDTLDLMRVMDAARAQLGVVYPGE